MATLTFRGARSNTNQQHTFTQMMDASELTKLGITQCRNIAEELWTAKKRLLNERKKKKLNANFTSIKTFTLAIS